MKNHLFLAAILAGTCLPAHGYELATHGRLTYEAYRRSIFVPDQNNSQDPQLAKNLGVDLRNTDVFGKVYFDFSNSDVRERTAKPFETEKRRMPDGVDPLSIAGWLLRGAIREDDWTGVNIPFCHEQAPNPQDDAYPNPPDRPKNHFYDPVYDRPLTISGVSQGDKAPDWALGATNAFANPMPPDTSRRNHFTVFDAREAMFRALTLKSKNADGSYTDLGPSGSLKTKNDVRNAYWATTFRALGDAAHLVQDMGQPQHTCKASQINGTHHARSYA